MYRRIQLFGAVCDLEERASHVVRYHSYGYAKIAVVLATAAPNVGEVLFQDIEQRGHDVVAHLGCVSDLLQALPAQAIAQRGRMFTDGLDRVACFIEVRPVRKAIFVWPIGEIGPVGVIKRIQQPFGRSDYLRRKPFDALGQ